MYCIENGTKAMMSNQVEVRVINAFRFFAAINCSVSSTTNHISHHQVSDIMNLKAVFSERCRKSFLPKSFARSVVMIPVPTFGLLLSQ